MFDFIRIEAGDTDCDIPEKTNTLTFRSNTDPEWSVTTCLTDLTDSVTYEGLSIEVEFNTVDPEVYGFILEFTAGMIVNYQRIK